MNPRNANEEVYTEDMTSGCSIHIDTIKIALDSLLVDDSTGTSSTLARGASLLCAGAAHTLPAPSQ
ncbi:hypothetical protein E2C01_017087 [Portunus trituberculatus]|uniref:Uncharacterized protein n=1 Tax=Portunus trituberculatus TaxID=210409 RepID=A0A5B7DSV4_PORTR|nr:hypothetical protein [Portunus trituberculatus]